MSFDFLEVRRDGAVEHVTLNRPDVRNAINDRVIDELRRWADTATLDRTLRVVVLGGAGKAFSAGADLEWMKRGAALGREDIVRESRRLHEMLMAIDRLPQAVIGRVQGAAIAGGVGLVSVCDAVVAADGAMFGFSEVRLGIVPAIISPFVTAKIGASAARELFVTGERFDAPRARELGLVHRVVEPEGLDWAVGQYVQQVLGCAPGAVAAAKSLLRAVAGRTPETAFEVTGEAIAERRTSDEGRAGVAAFFEKRPPPWAR